MTIPTQAQIEAAAEALRDFYCPISDKMEMAKAALTAAAEVGRDYTCHPADNPPDPCPKQYAYTECVKAATIERCAQVADDYGGKLRKGSLAAQTIAAAIRALKDKPATDQNLVYPGKDPDFVFPEE